MPRFRVDLARLVANRDARRIWICEFHFMLLSVLLILPSYSRIKKVPTMAPYCTSIVWVYHHPFASVAYRLSALLNMVHKRTSTLSKLKQYSTIFRCKMEAENDASHHRDVLLGDCLLARVKTTSYLFTIVIETQRSQKQK